MEHQPLRVLTVVTTAFAKNGITGVVKNYAFHIDPAEVAFDYVLINEPDAADRAAIEARGGRIFVIGRRARKPLAYKKALTGVLLSGHYDCIHAHGNSATLYLEMKAAADAGVPVRIAHSHNTNTSFPLVHALLWKKFDALTTHRLACGDAAGRWLFHDRPFVVLPNAIDTARFTFTPELRKSARARFHLGGERVYLHVGSFNKAKNHAFLIDSFTNVHAKDAAAKLLMVGDGPLRTQIKRRATASLIAKCAMFSKDGVDPAEAYAAADAFLLPSLHEGLPLTLLEAQSMGLACLVSDAVTTEANVTGLVTYKKLSDGMDVFANAAMALEKRTPSERAAAYQLVADAGYDISRRAGELTAFYRRCTEGKAE